MISFVDRNSPLMPRTFLLPPLFSDRNNRIIRWKKYENSGWLSSQRKWYQAAYAPEEFEFTTGSTENVNENNGGVVAGDDDLFTEEKRKIEKGANRRRRKMELSWCGPESCKIDAIRETIVGDDHHIKFEGPATGQVVYKWVSDDVVVDDGKLDNSKGEMVEGVLAKVETSSVLVLVKWNDDELLRVAADAVQNLTSQGKVKIMLFPDVAAKFNYYGVSYDHIQLFDPVPEPGYGGNHLASNDSYYNNHANIIDFDHDNSDITNDEGKRTPIPDLIVTLGGDGLLLYTSALFPGPCPPILCFAGGSLGFLTPFHKDDMVEVIQKFLGLPAGIEREEFAHRHEDKNPSKTEVFSFPGNDAYASNFAPCGSYSGFCLSMRMRLDCRVTNREGVTRARFSVLNEVTIDRGSNMYLAALECFCDDVHLTTVQADGVIFSTPTGSTAYSMSAGGSVVHPAVPAILVTPICPHVLSFRSMVFPDHVTLRCFVPDDARANAYVAFDGKHRRELHRGDSILISMSTHPVPTINQIDHSSDWLNSLKRNFNFNTRPRQNPL